MKSVKGNDMRRMILGVAVAILGMSMLVKVLFGVALHLFTVFVAYSASGFFAALLTLIFPVMAQIYWIYNIWANTGVFLNLFTLLNLAYVGLWVVIIFFSAIAAALDD
jgi:hypothetical protein